MGDRQAAHLTTLDVAACWVRLVASDFGVLATTHAERGVDLVPVVFAVHEDRIVIPIDTVKAKSTIQLQRLSNIDRDPRVAVLVERADADWSQLWWVRAHGRATEMESNAEWVDRLALKYPAYRAAGAIVSLIVVKVESVTGWSAT